MTVRDLLAARGATGGGALDLTLKELLAGARNPRDQFNQYSYPFGLPELRRAIADYTDRLYGRRPDPEEEITVVLGATEGMTAAFLRPVRAGRRRRGDAALPRALCVAGRHLRARAPVRGRCARTAAPERGGSTATSCRRPPPTRRSRRLS